MTSARADGGRRSLPRSARWAVVLVVAAVLGGVAGLAGLVGLPTLTGSRALVVLSGSMEPTVSPGDVVVVRPIGPREAQVGDVVTFNDPHHRSRLITHRVVSLETHAGMVTFETKGDANEVGEEWAVDAHGRIGLVRYKVPFAGYALAWLGSGTGVLIGLVLPASALGAIELVRIWHPQRPETWSLGSSE